MTPAFPPSSSVKRFRGSSPLSRHPVGLEPVNVTFLILGSVTISSARPPEMVSTDIIPSGRLVSANSSPSSRAPSGVALAGFTMIGAPTPSAGATLWATRLTGKLNGAIPSTGP